MDEWGKDIHFEHEYYNDVIDETLLMFHASLDYISKEKYSHAISSEISITFRGKDIPENVKDCEIAISPTREVEQFLLEDYDWQYYSITQDQYKKLIYIYYSYIYYSRK